MIFAYSYFDIVIKRSSLEKVKKGLSQEFINAYEVSQGHFDDNLIAIRAAMSSVGAEMFADEIAKKYKLVHIQNGVAQDLVCVMRGEILAKCFWLKSIPLKEDMVIGGNFYPKHFPCYEFITTKNEDKNDNNKKL